MASIIDQTRPDQTRPDQNCALISVIVPAYNVEKYLAKCLDSILTQTYKNLEVILIDDGSTDSTGRICDEYSRKDERVRVIHQENQGVAESRNVGLREAKGEWIQFVDSDDWIDPETIETCYSLALKHDAEIVCFQCVLEYDSIEYGGRKTNHGDNRSYTDRIMNGEEAFSIVMLPGYLEVYTCNKLIKKCLFDDVIFPSVKTGEDLSVIYKIIIKARTVMYLAKEFYHYLQRSSSLIHVYKPDQLYNNFNSMLGYIKLANERKLCENKDYMINILSGSWFWKITAANSMIKNNVCNMEYIRKIQKEIRPFTVIQSKLSSVRKIQILLFKFSLRLYAMVYMRAKRK